MDGMVMLEVVPSSDPRAQQALRGFFDTVSAIFYGRRLSESELTRSMADHLSPDIDPPAGLYLVAHDDGRVLGGAGLRWLATEGTTMGEVKHLHVTTAARGQGIGERLMRDLEARAVEHGCTAMRLDTRSDLLASRRLYDRLGYVEVPAYNDNPDATNWYEKPLS